MRTQDEIVERARQVWDPVGWQRAALVECLDYDHAREWLVRDATPGRWALETPADEAAIRATARECVAYGWTMVEEHRARSASRTVEKLIGWLWALDDDDLLVKMETTPYPQYGAARLYVVCRSYGWPVPDDRAGIARMIAGRPCHDGCDRGCGRDHR